MERERKTIAGVVQSSDRVVKGQIVFQGGHVREGKERKERTKKSHSEREVSGERERDRVFRERFYREIMMRKKVCVSFRFVSNLILICPHTH